jgi:hypothetical protein
MKEKIVIIAIEYKAAYHGLILNGYDYYLLFHS